MITATIFKTKLAMCGFFGVRPMFVARMMPKNYISDVARAGGFSLIFGNQHYPLMSVDLGPSLTLTQVIAGLDPAIRRFEA
jgi:hypothetical protein